MKAFGPMCITKLVLGHKFVDANFRKSCLVSGDVVCHWVHCFKSTRRFSENNIRWDRDEIECLKENLGIKARTVREA